MLAALSNYTQDDQAPRGAYCRQRNRYCPSDRSDKSVDVLLVEGNPGDARLAQEVFRNSERYMFLRCSAASCEMENAKSY